MYERDQIRKSDRVLLVASILLALMGFLSVCSREAPAEEPDTAWVAVSIDSTATSKDSTVVDILPDEVDLYSHSETGDLWARVVWNVTPGAYELILIAGDGTESEPRSVEVPEAGPVTIHFLVLAEWGGLFNKGAQLRPVP